MSEILVDDDDLDELNCDNDDPHMDHYWEDWGGGRFYCPGQ